MVVGVVMVGLVVVGVLMVGLAVVGVAVVVVVVGVAVVGVVMVGLAVVGVAVGPDGRVGSFAVVPHAARRPAVHMTTSRPLMPPFCHWGLGCVWGEFDLRTGQGGTRKTISEQLLRQRFTRGKNRKRETEEGESSG